MSEIDTQLSKLFDDVAATIDAPPHFEDVLLGGGGSGGVTTTAGGGNGRRPFRRGFAAAAAAVLLLGGVAAAAYQLDGDDAGTVATETVSTPPSTQPAPTTTEAVIETTTTSVEPPETTVVSAEEPDPTTTVLAPVFAHSAELGEGDLAGDPVIQYVLGSAAPGEAVTARAWEQDFSAVAGEDGSWKIVLELHDVPAATEIPIRVTFADTDDVFEFVIETPPPPTTTTTKPPETTVAKQPVQFVEFTATTGGSYVDGLPMKQVLYGTATPGSTILATSAYGHVTTVAGEKGHWETHLKMYEVPVGTNVRITVTASGFGQEFEFWLARPVPEAKPFTAEKAAAYTELDPMKVVFHGTGAAGSVVRIGSDYGVTEAVVGSEGYWETHLKLYEVPAGTTVWMRATNSASEQVYEFSITKPEAPTYEFTANAALTESSKNPPVNEYWGTATPGATISVDSPYGSTQVTAGELGKWDARIEYPEAPYGVVFQVTLTSSKDDGTYVFNFKRVEAV